MRVREDKKPESEELKEFRKRTAGTGYIPLADLFNLGTQKSDYSVASVNEQSPVKSRYKSTFSLGDISHIIEADGDNVNAYVSKNLRQYVDEVVSSSQRVMKKIDHHIDHETLEDLSHKEVDLSNKCYNERDAAFLASLYKKSDLNGVVILVHAREGMRSDNLIMRVNPDQGMGYLNLLETTDRFFKPIRGEKGEKLLVYAGKMGTNGESGSTVEYPELLEATLKNLPVGLKHTYKQLKKVE